MKSGPTCSWWGCFWQKEVAAVRIVRERRKNGIAKWQESGVFLAAGLLMVLLPVFAAGLEGCCYWQPSAADGPMRPLFFQDIACMANLPLALFMILLLMMYYTSPMAPRRLYRQLIAFLVLFQVWMLCASLTRGALDAVGIFLFRAATYLLPAMANMVIYQIIDRPYRRLVWLTVLAYLGLFLLAAAAELAGFQGLERGLSFFYLLVFVLEPVVGYRVLCAAFQGNRYCRAVLLPLAGILAAGVLDGAAFQFHWLKADGYALPYVSFTLPVFVLFLVHQQILRERSLTLRTAGLEDAVAEAVARSEMDALTGCYNRNRLDAALEQEIRLHGQEAGDFSVVMMDIDWFKQVNDQYGHDAGDRVLASFAERIRSRIKRTDVFVRWGGEEFVLICRGCGREEAGRMAERLRREVERADLFFPKRITCSMGVAVWHGNGDTAEKLMKRVDEALYEAKRSGRNRVCCEPQPIPDETLQPV